MKGMLKRKSRGLLYSVHREDDTGKGWTLKTVQYFSLPNSKSIHKLIKTLSASFFPFKIFSIKLTTK